MQESVCFALYNMCDEVAENSKRSFECDAIVLVAEALREHHANTTFVHEAGAALETIARGLAETAPPGAKRRATDDIEVDVTSP